MPNLDEVLRVNTQRPDELVIRGHTYDKFYGTPLDLALRNRDYRVTAVTDAMATLWPELQEACFAVWRRKFARLATTDETVRELDTF